jgi:ABC-2 type transport system permease protein
MKTFVWLVKREFWEHRGGFLWAPLVAGSIFLVLNVMGLIAAEVIGLRHGMHFGGSDIHMLLEKADMGDLAKVGVGLDLALLSATGIIGIVMGFVVLFYCLGALYDDRRDRSILFWKSLPVSDARTVLSKVVSAVVLVPIIAVVIGIVIGVIQLILFAIVLSFHGINVWQLLMLAHPIRTILAMITAIPLYALWALPAVGWLMLCSAWSRSKPFLWAIAAPLVAGLMVTWFNIMGLFNLSSTWFWHHIVQRIILSVFPGSNLIFDEHQMQAMAQFGDDAPSAMLTPGSTFLLLGSIELWIGVVAGTALIAAAIWFRRVRDDS